MKMLPALKLRITGSELHPNIRKKIFDMFYRASEQSNGSGLGLYIVRETLARLNGSIQLKSILGQGSTFTLRLPNHL
ncbi:MAG: sensor histidine kinase [Bacteroidetes bacterium CHB5]|nr:sensor histidine kinase [Bacteroidetes bacterium CHB5]